MKGQLTALVTVVVIVGVFATVVTGGAASNQAEPQAEYIDISGELKGPNGEPVSNASLLFMIDDIGEDRALHVIAHTNNTGYWEATVRDDSEFDSYDVIALQANVTVGEGSGLQPVNSEAPYFPDDGIADVYPVANDIYPTDGESYEWAQPMGFETMVKVHTNQSVPLPNATVQFYIQGTDISPAYYTTKKFNVNEDGEIEPEYASNPGIELNNFVNITAYPPDSKAFEDEDPKHEIRDIHGPIENITFTFNGTPTLQPDRNTITIGSGGAQPGNTTSINLSTNASHVAGYQANITFEPGVAQFENATGGAFDAPVTNYDNAAGWVALAQSSADEHTAPTLAHLTFNLTAKNGTQTSLSFVESDTLLTNQSGGNITIHTYDGGELSACKRGDANGDGAVTSGDATLILRSVVGLNTQDSLTACADANDDGQLTSGDATIVLRIVVGLE